MTSFGNPVVTYSKSCSGKWTCCSRYDIDVSSTSVGMLTRSLFSITYTFVEIGSHDEVTSTPSSKTSSARIRAFDKTTANRIAKYIGRYYCMTWRCQNACQKNTLYCRKGKNYSKRGCGRLRAYIPGFFRNLYIEENAFIKQKSVPEINGPLWSAINLLLREMSAILSQTRWKTVVIIRVVTLMSEANIPTLTFTMWTLLVMFRLDKVLRKLYH